MCFILYYGSGLATLFEHLIIILNKATLMEITMKHLLMCLSVMLISIGISKDLRAQTSSISGVVRDAGTNEPIAGAGVMVKGTSRGTSSNLDGTYTLKVNVGETVLCQFYGYKDMEIVVDKAGKVDFLLVEDTQTLEQAVVVGYGTLKKTQLVGAVENLSGKEIEGRTNAAIARSLQGQIPGLNIIQVDGKPSHQGKIYVRGTGTSYQTRKSVGSAGGKNHSIGQGGSALVLIDGVEGDLSTVNPEDVETVSVLKDAASAAVYGARGAFGVILVTTKNPGKSAVKVNYNGSVALNRRTVIWEDNIITDGYEWSKAFVDFFTGNDRTPLSSGTFPSTVNNRNGTFSKAYFDEMEKRFTDPSYENYGKLYGLNSNGNYDYYGSTNWLKLFYKPVNMTTTHNLSVSGGNEKSSFSLTGRYYTQEGIYKIGDETFNSYSLRGKGTINLTKRLKLSNNTSLFSRTYHQPMVTGGSEPLLRQFEHRGQPIYTPYNEDGTLTFYGAAVMYGAFKNKDAYQENKKLDIISTTTLEYEPVKNVLKFSGDFTYKAIRSTAMRLSSTQEGYSSPNNAEKYNLNSYKSDWRYNTDYISSNIVGTWTPKLGPLHDLNIVAGWNIEMNEYRRLYISRKDVLYPSKPSFELFGSDEFSIEDGGWDKRMVGVFGRVNYTLLKRYIFEFAARYDQSSLFPKNQRGGFFPSGSIGWRISEEPWMKWSDKWLDNLKLRGNLGSLGNASIEAYSFMRLMEINKSSIVINHNRVPYTTAPGAIPESLTWETITTYDVGLDADLFKNRLSFSFDWYRRYTNDAHTNGPTLPSVLGTSTPKGNYGSLLTQGWELTVGWRDSFKLGGKPLNYGAKFSIWDSRTWVLEYYNLNGNIYDYYKGKELGEIWGFRTAGIFSSNAEANNWAIDTFHKNGNNFRAFAGDLKFVDLNGDGFINPGAGTLDDHGDLERIGNEMPRYHYGLNLNASWNGIGLSMFFQGVGKRDWYPAVESGLFYGMYNRPYSGYYLKDHQGDNYAHVDYSTENWVVTNMDSNPYWTRRVGYAANRNVGPLSFENDHFLQNVAYLRLKNLTVDYTFPSKITKKINIDRLKVYLSGENLLTFSPMYKYTPNFDPEVIGVGDSDFSKNSGLQGLGGTGEGYSYPMLKTYTLGVNITF